MGGIYQPFFGRNAWLKHVKRKRPTSSSQSDRYYDGRRGQGTAPNYLTAYQILARLPGDLRAVLIAERGRGGRGHGTHYAAPSIVMTALRSLTRLGEVEVAYLDTGGLQLLIDDERVGAGNRVCGLYRIRS